MCGQSWIIPSSAGKMWERLAVRYVRTMWTILPRVHVPSTAVRYPGSGLVSANTLRVQATDAPSTGADFSRAGQAERVPDCGRAPSCQTMCTCALRFTQAPGSFGDRVPEGEERYRHCPAGWQGAEFYG